MTNLNKALIYLNLIFIIFFASWFFLNPYFKEYSFTNSLEVSINKIDQKASDFIFTLNDKSGEKRLIDAKLALSGEFSFQNENSEYKIIESSRLATTWNSGHYVFRNTSFDSNNHEFLGHSLFLLADLIYAYKETSNENYLSQGVNLFFNWFENNPRYNLFPSHYSWGDHTVALRLLNVVFFISFLNEKNLLMDYPEIEEVFDKFLAQHISFLLSDNNYSFKNNHGIFQDISLLYSSHFIENNSQIIDFSAGRLLKQVQSSYSNNAIHLENSPGYHVVITELIKKVFKFDLKPNKKLNEIKSIIDKASSLYFILADNNNILAPIGDTIYPFKVSLNEKNNSNYSFVNDSQAGYLIYKNKEFYIFIKSTGSFSTHSHDDAGSFVMGFDQGLIISEVGFLDYTNSKQRVLSKMPYSHNSLLVFNGENLVKNYCFIEEVEHDASKLFVVSVCRDSTSKSPLYSRHYNYNSKYGLSIEQYILSPNVSRWEQPIHPERKIKLRDINIINKKLINLSVGKKDAFISTDMPEVKIIEGGENYGYYAEPFADLVDHGTLLFSGTTQKSSFKIVNSPEGLKSTYTYGANPIPTLDESPEFIKETRPLQILFDLRVIILSIYITVFFIVFYIFILIITRLLPRQLTAYLALYLLFNTVFQSYLSYRIFLL